MKKIKKIKFFLALAGDGVTKYIVTDRKVCFVGYDYSTEETVKFLKENGHKPCTYEEAQILVDKFNDEINRQEEEAYEEYLEAKDKNEEEYGEGSIKSWFFPEENYSKQRIYINEI